MNLKLMRFDIDRVLFVLSIIGLLYCNYTGNVIDSVFWAAMMLLSKLDIMAHKYFEYSDKQ